MELGALCCVSVPGPSGVLVQRWRGALPEGRSQRPHDHAKCEKEERHRPQRKGEDDGKAAPQPQQHEAWQPKQHGDAAAANGGGFDV